MIDNVLQNATIWVETIRELAGLGILLYAIIFVVLVASVGQILTDEIPMNSTSGVLTWIGFLAAVLALFMIVRFARQAIYQSITK